MIYGGPQGYNRSENKRDTSDRYFYQKHHSTRNLPKYKNTGGIIPNYFPIELDASGFFRNIREAFLIELDALQQEYIAFVSGIYRNAQFISFPGTPKIITATMQKVIGAFIAKVADVKRFYLAYVEHGTGVNAMEGWTPGMMDALIGAERGIQRPADGRIVPRGKGYEWTDPGGETHPGANFLFIPLQKGVKPNRDKESRKGDDRSQFKIRPWSMGQHGQHRLEQKNFSFLTKEKLYIFAQKVYDRALSMPGSFKQGSRYEKFTPARYKKFEQKVVREQEYSGLGPFKLKAQAERYEQFKKNPGTRAGFLDSDIGNQR